LHFRNRADEEAAVVELEAIAEQARHDGLIARFGRKVLEVLPPLDANKGTAIRALLDDARLSRALVAGDDTTDLDAFRGLAQLVEEGRLGTAVRVGVRSDEGPSALAQEADVMVDGTDGVRDMLQALLD
jgi:trehalose 6-phosphate phosphatase